MGGRLCFFTSVRPANPRAVLGDLLELTGANVAWLVGQEDFNSSSWEAFQTGLPAAARTIHRSGSAEIAVTTSPAAAKKAEQVPIPDVPKFYEEPWGLLVQFAGSPLGNGLEQEIAAAVPKEIRGDWIPAAPVIKLGWHDVFGSVEHRQGRYHGRAFLSFELEGEWYPRDWARFRAALFDLPQVRELRRNVEAIVGPVEQCLI